MPQFRVGFAGRVWRRLAGRSRLHPLPVTRHPSPVTESVTFLAALALAAVGQWQAPRNAPLAVGCFVCAMLFTVVARRGVPAEPALAAGAAVRSGVGRALLLFGWLLCFAAAVLLLAERGTVVQVHGVWFAGLAALLAAALAYRRREARRDANAPPAVWNVRSALAALALLVQVAVLFGWKLESIPVEVHGDEAEVGNDAITLLTRRPLDLFRTGWYELPILHAGPTAVFLQLFGIHLTALRAASAVLGAATVLLLFAFARRLWDLPTAFVAAALLAGNSFFVHLARAGYHYVDTPFLSVLALWLFARVWSSGSAAAAIACGIALGLGVQTYPASRLVPVLLSLTWLAWWIGAGARRREQLALHVVIAGTALAVAAPMGAYFVGAPHELWYRVQETSVFTEDSRRHLAAGYGTDSLLEILLIQLRAALTLFHVTGDTSVQYGLEAPLLDPVSGVLFAIGFAAALARAAAQRELLLLVWLVVPVVTGAALTIDTPFYPRISGAVPFAALAAALGLRAVFQALETVGVRRALAGAAAAVAVSAALAINAHRYFVRYAPVYRHSPALEIARFVRTHGAGKVAYMVGGWPQFSIRHGAIQFLAHGHPAIDVEDPRQVRHGQFDRERSIFVVMAQGKELLAVLEERFGPLAVELHAEAGEGNEFYTVVPVGP